MSLQIELGRKTRKKLGRIARALENLTSKNLHIEGGRLMFIVQDNHPAVNFTVTAPSVVDAEGHAVDPQPPLTISVTSDANNVVEILFDEAAGTGTATFGEPGIANVNATVKLQDTTLVGSFGSQFTVTTGDPAAITGGSIAFDGLTES